METLEEKLVNSEREVVGMMEMIGTEKYLADYMSIENNDEFVSWIQSHTQDHIGWLIYEKFVLREPSDIISSLSQLFLLGFLFGYNFCERNPSGRG